MITAPFAHGSVVIADVEVDTVTGLVIGSSKLVVQVCF